MGCAPEHEIGRDTRYERGADVSSTRTAAPHAQDDPYGSVGGGDTSEALRFSLLTGPALSGAIDAVTGRGDALVFSRTSDGGAVSLRVLHDKMVTKWYAPNLDALRELLERLAKV